MIKREEQKHLVHGGAAFGVDSHTLLDNVLGRLREALGWLFACAMLYLVASGENFNFNSFGSLFVHRKWTKVD